MLSQFGGLSSLTMLAAALTATLAFLVMSIRGYQLSLSRRGVTIFAGFWILIITVEFWIFGPSSFVNVEDEGEFSYPLFIYLARWYDGGQFTHHVAGGLYAPAMFSSGFSFIHLERLLFEALPPWAALGVHKVMVATVGFVGAYKLARHYGADRLHGAVIAAWFCIAHRYSILITLTHGLGYVAPALACYVLVARLGKPNYIIPALGFFIIHAISFTPTHSIWALWPAVLVLWAATGFGHPIKFASVCVIGTLLSFANWWEPIAAMFSVAGESYRGSLDIVPDTVLSPFRMLIGYPWHTILIGLAVIILIRKDRSLLVKSIGMIAGITGITAIMLAVPWSAFGLSFLDAFDFTYITFSTTAVVVVIVAWASKSGSIATILGRPILIAAPIVASLGWIAAYDKVHNGAQWVGRGGQSVVHTYSNLRDPDWMSPTYARVATVPYQLKPNTLAANGLEVFGSVVNLYPQARGEYFLDSFPVLERVIGSGYNYITQQAEMDYLCCANYELSRFVDIDRLRHANVGFVASILPLTDQALTKVSGPTDGAIPPRRGDPVVHKISSSIRRLFTKKEAYIYALSNPVPRAYIARQVMAMDESTTKADFYDHAVSAAAQGDAVIHSDADLSNTALSTTGAVTDVKRIRDGYDISVSMQTSGYLVLNVIPTRDWSAKTDSGQLLKLVPANGIHQAAKIPSGDYKVHFRYARP
jgi:hypothetical protein